MADTHIKIKPVVPRVQYVGNGVTTDFAYSFAIFDETDMEVYIGDTKIDPDATVIIGEGDDAVEYPVYTITGVGEEDGGEVVFTVAPENDAIITLVRNVPVERMTDFQEGGTFRPKNLNDELDRQTAFCQQIEEALNRCVKVDVTSQIDPSAILPQVERLYESVDNIDTVSEHVDEIDTVSNNMTDVNNCSTNMAEIQAAPTQASNAASSATSAAASATAAAISAAGTHFKLFHHDWFDYQLNDMAWLRADTFSWQNGNVYSNAYNHLVDDVGYVMYMIPDDDLQIKFYRAPDEDTEMYAWTNQFSTLYTVSEFPQNGDDFYYNGHVFGTVLSTGIELGSDAVTPTTETISGYTITYYPAEDGHKIILPDQETTAINIYNATGVAWYYVLDTDNTRFKLPRTKHGFVGYRTAPGEYVPAGLPNITGTLKQDGLGGGSTTSTNNGVIWGTEGAFGTITSSGSNRARYTVADNGLCNDTIPFDASRSSSVYGNSDTVQPPATQMYLYFYVGQFTQTATEQTAGLNSSLFNDKVDLNLNNVDNGNNVAALALNSKGIRTVITTYTNGVNWYRVYSDKWCEQGGTFTITATGDHKETINFLKTFANTNYQFFVTGKTSSSDLNPGFITICMVGPNCTAAKVEVKWYTSSYTTTTNDTMHWRACGYIS